MIKIAQIFFLAVVALIGNIIRKKLAGSDSPTFPPQDQSRPSQPTNASENPNPTSVSATLVFQEPLALSTPKITSIEQIVFIPIRARVSIDTLQRRALPSEKGGETFRGFIDEGSLLDIIWTQWEQVAQVGLTHIEIADHLQYLIKAACKAPKSLIYYDPKTKAIEGENISIFQVMIFKKEAPDTDIFRSEQTGLEVGNCYEEALIVNTVVQGKYIRWTPIRERYIREWGFYSKGMDFGTVKAVLMLDTR
jgi:hypothetical protein